MADPRGFLMVTEREVPKYRPVEVRLRDFREVDDRMEPARVSRQASRCMDCGIPFCHMGCPLGNLIPEWNTLTWRGGWREASERLHATNNFPEFTGRLCPAPCESACVLGINRPPVTIKNIEHTVADQAFEQGLVEPQIPQQLTGYTVAVVGSGPAGLAAAQQLTRAGHTVAVFERADAIGGLLRYGIPEFKMEKAVLDRRLEQMREEGTRFYTGVEVGRDLSAEELRERFDAVVLALGSTVPRDLPIPGREGEGIYQAVDFLTRSTKHVLGGVEDGWVSAEGKDVVVIGGGDTGADCIGTSLRQGARSVTSLEIMPQPPSERGVNDPWPTFPKLFTIASSHEEGGERLYSIGTLEFLRDDGGALIGLRVVDMDCSSGRPAPVPGTERVLDAQMVLLAMGFVGVERPGLVDDLGVSVDARGRIERDADWSSGVEGVFVAGDAGRGQSLIVWAIAEGRSTAAAVDRYLRGRTELPAPVVPTTMSYRP